jgi:hypothetical protein
LHANVGPATEVRGYTNIIVVMHTHCVKRLQIMIEKEVDARPLPPLSADPIGRMAGADDCEPAAIDDVVYR